MPLPPVDFPTLGWQVIDWIETYLCHGPGDVQGERWAQPDGATRPGLPIDDDEALLICWIYRVHPQGYPLEGRRLVHRAVYSRPKGRRKSEIAGALMCAEALGPVRCDGFDAHGEPVGVPVTYPFIRCCATEEEQSGNTYDNVVYMLTEGDATDEYDFDVGRSAESSTRVFIKEPGGGEIRPSTSGDASKDGGKESAATADEALALDTLLPTPHGWTTMGEVQAGDFLLGADGAPTRVLRATDVQHGRECYRVRFSDGTSVVASDGHLWQTRVVSGPAKLRVRTTGEMVADGRRFCVPAPRPYVTPAGGFDIDPYVLGLWLGDGDSRNATISSGNEDVAQVERLIAEAGYTTRRCATRPDRANLLYVSLPGSHRNRFSPVRGLKVRLADAGLLGAKHVPTAYLRGSIGQRTALLQGLMDSDGHVSHSGGCTFVGCDLLTSAVVDLLRTLGQTARRAWQPDERSRHGGVYKVHFTPRGELVPFRLPRKVARLSADRQGAEWVTITSVEPVESEPVRCVAVDAPGQLFLAGEGGHVTHNTHLYISRGLRAMYRTVARNTGKRSIAEPWMLDTTTMHAPGERSIAEQAAERYASLSVERAVLKHGVLYDHAQGEIPQRFGDDRSLIKAMRPGYGAAAEWMDFERIAKIVRDAEEPEEEAYRYFLNRPYVTASHWLPPDDIAAVLAGFDVPAGSLIGMGFDGSESDDHTVLMGCTESGDLFTIGYWTPDNEDLGWHAEVDATVDWAFETFNVVRFYADPPWWQEELGKWAERHSDPERQATLPVAEFWTNADAKMAVACGALRTEVRNKRIRINPVPLRTPELRRDGRTLLQWHFENARRKKVRVKLEDRAEDAYVVRKERPGSALKIDSVPSGVLARRARDDGLKLGEFKPRRTYSRAAWQ
ncbi:MAG: hypothetical protein Q8O56_06265 [Solirubrobacteraceae bacterium]|nr:hypothetical protein [Solirubrobacteraceae bacterium]